MAYRGVGVLEGRCAPCGWKENPKGECVLRARGRQGRDVGPWGLDGEQGGQRACDADGVGIFHAAGSYNKQPTEQTGLGPRGPPRRTPEQGGKTHREASPGRCERHEPPEVPGGDDRALPAAIWRPRRCEVRTLARDEEPNA